MSAGRGVSGPNKPKILIRDRRTERERGGGERAREGPAGMSVATGLAVFIRTFGTHGAGETRMELDPGSASRPSHHNHYQSRWEDERRRGLENRGRRTKKKQGTERRWKKNGYTTGMYSILKMKTRGHTDFDQMVNKVFR